MYQGKHNKQSHKGFSKSVTLLVSLILIIGVTIGGTIAFLVAETKPVANTFTPSEVTTEVEETLSGSRKSNVKIQNTGDTEAWIRAAVVVTWQDVNGNVYGQAPEAGENYTNWIPGTDWVKGADGFYYYTSPVAVQTSTANALIDEIQPIGNPPADGYYLTVEIIGSGIQSVPNQAVIDAWGIANGGCVIGVSDGKLSIKTQ